MKNILIGCLATVSVGLSFQGLAMAQALPLICYRESTNTYFRGLNEELCQILLLERQRQQLQQLQEDYQSPAQNLNFTMQVFRDNVNLRSGNSTNSNIQAVLAKGTIVRFHSERDGWSWVTVDRTGQNGWIRSDMLNSD